MKKIFFISISLLLLCAFPVRTLSAQDAYKHFESGISLYDMGDYDGALSEFIKAAQIKPDFAEAYFNMGIILDSQEKFSEAIDAYKRVVQIDPELDDVFENLCLDSYLVGNIEEAGYYVRMADSLGVPIDNALKSRIEMRYRDKTGGTMLTTGEKAAAPEPVRQGLADEIDALEKELKQKKASAADLVALGSKYRQIGALDKAIETLSMAIDMDEKNSLAQGEISLCYYLNGQEDLFVKHFRRAQELGFTSSLSLYDLYSKHLARD